MEYPFNLFALKNKVIILTGGAGFLGSQYIKALVEAGGQVIVWDKKVPDKTKNNAEEKSIYYKVDVTKEEEVKMAVQKITKKFGHIDILINNAAMNPAVGSPEAENQFKPYDEYSIELWRKELEVNLTGMMICIKEVVKVMKSQKSGVIVNVASELSEIAYDFTDVYVPGRYKSPGYITTKTGVVGLTRAWASYLGQYNIRINSFSPGGMQTAKQPLDFVKKYSRKNMLGRMAQINEYNGHILFLCSDASSFMTGHNLVVDGGKSCW